MAGRLLMILLLSVSTWTVCYAGNSLFFENGQVSTGGYFWASTFKPTNGQWFTGPDVIKTEIIADDKGANMCRDMCIKDSTCNSINLALTRPGEYYCELTKYHHEDDTYTVVEKEDGFSNWSLVKKRI